MTRDRKTVQLRLPATSANLGPGFDAMALALELFLELEATEIAAAEMEANPGAQFSIQASGRNADICAALDRNLLLETYTSVLAEEQRAVVPLRIRVHNDIPLGMGCGSSAAVRLAGVALANAFGELGWPAARIVEKAAQLEGHPDNVAACWHGGLAIAASAPRLTIVSLPPPVGWGALLVLPENPVATAKARAVLPAQYKRQDVVASVQAVALLTAAFAQGRADLMHLASRDCLHQPYRMELCPLLPALLPLAGRNGVLSVTLSGAGPAVLLLTEGRQPCDAIADLARRVCPVEMLSVPLCHRGGGARLQQAHPFTEP